MSSLFPSTMRRMALVTPALRASPIATSSAYTLNGWVRPMSSTSASSAQEDPSATTSSTAQLRPTTHYRVTLRRSAIGLPSRISKVLSAMGLKKRLQSVYLPQDAPVAGQILAVKELVHVDNVRRLDPPVGLDLEDVADWHAQTPDKEAIWLDARGDVVDWGREARRAPRGYTVVGNWVSQERDEEIRTRGVAAAAAATDELAAEAVAAKEI
ncbi:hypothetical protein BDZ90DRAFT_258127 [Jaminaea rosea]|uniref:Large ribosomal subunit protein uL30-like ferredoxin-like fold domain-containing protein n=1 Tax=Jaminaea rosea TaxID=1569628 RepID=A0A316V0L4_9BASI|nr:hypothetical protein BDZ90DRAFT_258127 [Jaminaea rosea]PWN31089.1 hypothetical protein BDZ90DRAFT_258127 [Jaminaea rosea]